MRVALPATAEEPAEPPASEVPLEVQPVGEPFESLRPSQELAQGPGAFTGLPSYHSADPGVVLQERQVRSPGHKCDPRFGVADPQGSQQRRREQDVADRAQSDHQDIGGHRANVDINFRYGSSHIPDRCVFWSKSARRAAIRGAEALG